MIERTKPIHGQEYIKKLRSLAPNSPFDIEETVKKSIPNNRSTEFADFVHDYLPRSHTSFWNTLLIGLGFFSISSEMTWWIIVADHSYFPPDRIVIDWNLIRIYCWFSCEIAAAQRLIEKSFHFVPLTVFSSTLSRRSIKIVAYGGEVDAVKCILQ